MSLPGCDRAIWVLAMIVALSGCQPKSDVPVGDAAENIRKVALGYVQFAASNRGVGPADEETLTKFIVQRNNITPEEAKAYFVSPRDQQPYVIRWGISPMTPAATSAEAPTPNIIIFENAGANGTRIVANGQLSVREMSAEEFSQSVPDHTGSGN